MTCERCKADNADCLTRERVRVCETCLCEDLQRRVDDLHADRRRLRAERDEARAEVERLKRPAQATESARAYARRRGALDGANAQALEGALTLTERERDEARAECDALRERQAMVRAFATDRNDFCASCGRPTYVGEDFNGPCVHDSDLVCALARVKDEAERVTAALDERNVARSERDEARAECDHFKAMLRERADSLLDARAEVERLKLACNAYWHDLARIGSLCEMTADEYPLKAVERTVRQFAEVIKERDEARIALRHLLLSRDASWMGGHDWNEAVDAALAVFEKR